MTLDDILEQITGNTSISTSGYLTDIKDVEFISETLPSAHLFWGDEEVLASDGAGVLISQSSVRTVSMMIMARVPEHGVDFMENIRSEIKSALIGFTHDGEQLTFSGGLVESINGGVIRWRDNYQFTNYLRYNR